MKIIFIYLIFFCYCESFGQWSLASGPLGTGIYSLAFSHDTLFAGTWYNGVYLSEDKGLSWKTAGLNGEAVRALLIWESNIFATTDNSGVFVSKDGTNTWTQINVGLTNFVVRDIIRSDSSLFVATWGKGVFKSDDKGTTWTEANNGIEEYNTNKLFFHGKVLYLGTIKGLYSSTNQGQSWDLVNQGTSKDYIYDFSANDSLIFAGSVSGILVSKDGGVNWSKLNESITGVYKIFCYGSTILTGTGQGILKSNDNGKNFSLVDLGYPNRGVRSIINYESELYIGTAHRIGGVIYKSIDYGESWEPTCLTSNEIRELSLFKDKIFIMTADGLFATENDGKIWTNPNASLFSDEISSIITTADKIYVSTQLNLYVSENAGLTFKEINVGLPNYTKFISLGVKENQIYVMTSEGVYFSMNGGQSWQKNNLTDLIYSPSLRVPVNDFLFTDQSIYVSTYGKGILRSSDNGHTWSEANEGLPTGYMYDLTVHHGKLFTACGSGIFTSTDSGKTWSNSSPIKTGNYNFYKFVSLNELLFCSGSSGKIYYSRNDGISWHDIKDNLPSRGIRAILIADSQIFVGLDNNAGVWSRPLSEITDIHIDKYKTASNLSIEQNYPNPFNPNTTIKYSVPKQSNVTIKIYDLLGRELTTLVNEEKSVGNYSVIFKGNNYSSGIYFYRITSDNYSVIKKMILLR